MGRRSSGVKQIADEVGVLIKEVIKGKVIKIRINDDGHFYSYPDGENGNCFHAPDLRGLRNKLRAHIGGASKLNIQFSKTGRGWGNDNKIYHGVITGIHDGTKAVLVQWADGKKEQERYYENDSWLRRLADKEVKQWNKLIKDQLAAEKAKDKFLKDHKLVCPELSSLVR